MAGEQQTVSAHDRECIRDLAQRVAEIAARPEQARRAEVWRDHNDLKPERPMVLIFPEGSWSEIMADWKPVCENAECRRLEYDLRMRIYSREELRDDNVIEPVVRCPIVVRDTGMGVDAKRTDPNAVKGAYHIDPVLVEERDIDKIRIPEVRVDWEATRRRQAFLEDLLGGILRVECTSGWGGSQGWAPMDLLIQWRGIDQLYVDLVERPAWVHEVMQRLLDARIAELDALEAQGALTLNNRNHYNGSGGVGYTRQLPQADFDGVHVRTKDMWAMATAQIFADVSPAMHEEFAFRYERRFLERFGLANYGCCEPLHAKFSFIKALPNLRRVSISPWCDVDRSVEELGNRVVLSWKPNPATLAATRWEPERVRRETREFCEKTRGCVTDIIMKDTHTCRNEPHRLTEWVRIALEVAREYPATGTARGE